MKTLLRRLLPDRHPLRLSWHRAKAFAAAARYGFPARKLTVIGVTGTDGKTTTVGMITHILRMQGIRTGALSTAFFQVEDDVRWNATQKTSPSPFAIQRLLREMVRRGCTHAVLEYSSHGLVQHRMNHTWPAAAGITNTTPEHLDYHKTMEQYRKDKGILFRMLKGSGTKVLNQLDGSFDAYAPIPSFKTVHYSSRQFSRPQPAGSHLLQLWLSNVHGTPLACSALLHVDGKPHTQNLTLPIAGIFNLENALCAVGCAWGVGVPVESSLKALSTFRGIPGRMERIDEGQDFSVFVDFTVTPAAYGRTLDALKASLKPGKRLLVLTGSCGDRMREKRPEVGRIVSAHADVMVVANEDPYTEDPARIIDEVWAGIDQAKTKAHRIPDRREAIAFLLKEAHEGDIVALCGKGSDTTMWVKDGKIPWNEREIVRELLRTRS